MQIELLKFPYVYMEYEKELQARELSTLLPNAIIISDNKHSTIISVDNTELSAVYELTYYCAYKINDSIISTRQGLYEKDDTIHVSKQHTRYSTHGLHEYKGKFNPQIVHALINSFGITKNHTVLDPFNGSGTTIVECAHAGISAYGTDINPMACFIANTKISALRIDTQSVLSIIKSIEYSEVKYKAIKHDTDERIAYLEKWIPHETLCFLEQIREIVKNINPITRDFLLLIASDLIRDYSFQEPSDLRIRRRKSPFPQLSFKDAFIQNSIKYIKRIEQVQKIDAECFRVHNEAINCDIKTDNPFKNIRFDAAITSPPYVTALPYIDTQRISLVWLGLCKSSQIGKLESSLIGTREILKSEKTKWEATINNNPNNLPDEIHTLITSMANALSEKDGFRKQAVPALVCKYFTEMKDMFINVYSMLKPNGLYGLVVGHNKTTLGGVEFNIDTPKLLAILSTNCGWKIQEILPLQTYKRYGLNAKNAICKESLIVLKKE